MENWLQIGDRKINLGLVRELLRKPDGNVVLIFLGGNEHSPETVTLSGQDAELLWSVTRAVSQGRYK